MTFAYTSDIKRKTGKEKNATFSGTKDLPDKEGEKWIPPTKYRSKTCRWRTIYQNVLDDTSKVWDPFKSCFH